MVVRLEVAGLLRREAGPPEVAVQQPRSDRVGDERSHRAGSHPVLPPARVVGGEDDRAGAPRAGRSAGPAAHGGAAWTAPRRTVGVDRRHLHHRHGDGAPLVEQLAAQRLVKALGGVLGSAVGRLQGNAPVRQCRPDVDDRPPVAPLHPRQHGHRAPDVPEVGDLGGPSVLLRGDVVEPGEDQGERHVTQTSMGPSRPRCARPRPRPGRSPRRRSARPGRRRRVPDLGSRSLQAALPARDESHPVSTARELEAVARPIRRSPR